MTTQTPSWTKTTDSEDEWTKTITYSFESWRIVTRIMRGEFKQFYIYKGSEDMGQSDTLIEAKAYVQMYINY